MIRIGIVPARIFDAVTVAVLAVSLWAAPGSAQDAAVADQSQSLPPDSNVAPPGADIGASQPAEAKPEPVGLTSSDSATEAGAKALPGLDLTVLSATRDRPLFQPDRRPVPPAPVVDAPPPEDQPVAAAPFDYELRGIIGSQDGSIAIISQPGLATPLHSHVGDVLNGWTLTQIEDRAVVFTGVSGEQRRLSLFDTAGAWSIGGEGVRHLTLGHGGNVAAVPDGVAAAPAAPAGSAPGSSPAGISAPDQNLPETPLPEHTPKEVRKVY